MCSVPSGQVAVATGGPPWRPSIDTKDFAPLAHPVFFFGKWNSPNQILTKLNISYSGKKKTWLRTMRVAQ